MVYEAIVKRLKQNNAKATLPAFDDKKLYDLLQLVCKAHHNHTLCDMTLHLMQEEVVTKDFRNGKVQAIVAIVATVLSTAF